MHTPPTGQFFCKGALSMLLSLIHTTVYVRASYAISAQTMVGRLEMLSNYTEISLFFFRAVELLKKYIF